MKNEVINREWVLNESVVLYQIAAGNSVRLQSDTDALRNAISLLNTILAALPPEIPADFGKQLREALESGLPEGPRPVP